MAGVVQQLPIEKEYEKNPDISPEDIKKLREWLKTQPHLPGDKFTDLDLFIIFHCCEKSQEVSKQVLDLHYTLKTLFTTFFKDRRIDKKMEFTIDKILFAALPTPTPEGYRAAYMRLLDTDPKNFMFADSVRVFMMMFELWQLEEGTWPGFIILIDMDQAVIGHLARLELMHIRIVLYFLQEAMLVKLKSVHFLNAPSFMDKLMMMLKPFMSKALADMVHIHQVGSDTLYKYVPKKAMPKNIGGDYKDYETIKNELLIRLKANQKFFDEEALRRVNQSLRPCGKATTVEDLFSIQGSFKKLDID
ncbi:alpha-tocopherol transfer protein-like [Achroia grisella]|uniref:alpha-tocopherol transfer protein-like n=1 Tax=Achroia grisella TaxID=688607 RepID=UPI0027D23CF3|nr:alpha-tocopherol transfer protein-like [Achroia grisella]